MNATDLFTPSEWLNSKDVENAGGEMTLTISKVERIEYDNDTTGKKEVKGKLSFVEIDKKLGLNVTNTNSVIKMYGGEDIEKTWLAKAVTLYVDYDVKNPKGGTTSGVRIRNLNDKGMLITEFWRKAKQELFMSDEEGREVVKRHNGDFAAALNELNHPSEVK